MLALRRIGWMLFAIGLLTIKVISLAHATQSGGQPATTIISDLQPITSGAGDRLSLRLPRRPEIRITSFSGPYRIRVDLKGMRLSPAHRYKIGGGVIFGYEIGNLTSRTATLVLYLKKPAIITTRFKHAKKKIGPGHLAIELKPTSHKRFVSGRRFRKTAPIAPRGERNKDDRPLVIIDAGHGGKDPGAIGVAGTREKTIALDFARELKARLDSTGRYRIFMTRAKDRTVKLLWRHLLIQYARGATTGPSLLLSIHADAAAGARGGGPRGASVYVYSRASNDVLAVLAGHQVLQDKNGNSSQLTRGEQMLRDWLGKKKQQQESSLRLARHLLDTLAGQQRLRFRDPQSAGLAILNSFELPAVLLELAFLSNAKDEELLRNASWRAAMVGYVARAIDGFFSKPAVAR